MVGVALQLIQIIASIMQRHLLTDKTGDPWDGRTLEWATPSPPPSYNFTSIPVVSTRDVFYEMKLDGGFKKVYEDIHMPKNTASGIYISIFAFLIGFGFIWEIIWLVVLSFVGMLWCLIKRTFDDDNEYTITAKEVKAQEEAAAKSSRPSRSRIQQNEEMGLLEFVNIVLGWLKGIVRRRK